MNKKSSKKLLIILVCLVLMPQPVDAGEKKRWKKIAAWLGGTSIAALFGYLIYRACRKPHPHWQPQDVQQKPFYRDIIDEYRNMTTAQLNELRSTWKGNATRSQFTSDNLIGEYITIAHELYRYAKEHNLSICCLGQSLAYVVLIVQFFKALHKEKAHNCIYIALSNDKNNVTRVGTTRSMRYELPDDDQLKIYYAYLKAQGIITHQAQTFLIVDQVESGKTIIEWESIVREMIRFLQPGEKLPKFRYYIHRVPLEQLPDNVPEFEYTFSLYQKPEKPTTPFETAWTSLVKAKGDLRLIPSFAPKDWDVNNPFKKPGKDARMLALRFLDYIITHGIDNF